MTAKEIAEEKWKIDSMPHFQMAHLRRFAAAGHPYFVAGTELAAFLS